VQDKPPEALKDSHGDPIAIDGLWALVPGNDGLGGSSDAIYSRPAPTTRRTACSA